MRRPSVGASVGDVGITLGALGHRLLRGYRVLAASGLAGAGLACAYLTVVPVTYRSQVAIRIDPRPLQVSRRDARAAPVYENQTAIAVLESQIRIMRSTPVLLAAIDRLGLDRHPEFDASDAPVLDRAWAAVTGLVAPPTAVVPPTAGCPAGASTGADCPDRARRIALARLDGAVTIRRATGSYVIGIQATSASADKAMRIAEAVAEAYRAEIRRVDDERLKRAAVQAASGLPALEDAVRADGDRIDRARRRIEAETGSSALIGGQQLAQVTRQLVDARAQLEVARARSESLAKLARSAGGLDAEAYPDAPSLDALRLQASSLSALEAVLTARLGPKHPDVVRIADQRRRNALLLRQELDRTAAAARDDLTRALSTVSQLSARADELKRTALATSTASVELRELERVAAADGTVLDGAMRRTGELDHGRRVDLDNVRVLGPADVPRGPTTSRPRLVAVAGLAGVITGAAWLAMRARPGGDRARGTAASWERLSA